MRLVLGLVALVLVQASSPSGSVRIAFGEDGRTGTNAQLGSIYFEVIGGGVRELPVRDFSRPQVIEHLAPGTYRFSVVAQTSTRALVSSEVLVARIVSAGQTVDLKANLIARTGAIRVIDAQGQPIAGAHYYTRPPAVSSSATERGEIPLALLAAGTELSIRTIHWGMTCHRVTAARTQTIVVPDAVESLVIATPIAPPDTVLRRRHIVSSPLLAGATVGGIPGADCAVPFEHFPVTLTNRNGLTEHTVLLPFGEYTVKTQNGREQKVSAPGRLELQYR